MRKTVSLTKQAAFDQRTWHIVDVAGIPIGRAATQIASVLRGKHKPSFTPNVDCGDFVVVLNAAKVHYSGNKLEGKLYYSHTGFPGGLVALPAKDLLRRHPDQTMRRAVWGMLPKGPLGRKLLKKLKIYPGTQHPHEAQQPAVRELAK